jgi:hypothetical protein
MFSACIQTGKPVTSSSNNDVQPNDSLYLKGDSILKRITASLGIADSTIALTTWYYSSGNKVNVRQEAKIAFEYFSNSLNTLTKDSPYYILCLEKLAICCHYQIRDYSYSDSLPQLYKHAMSYMDDAIETQLKLPASIATALLYERAAELAIPHFYFNYQSSVSVAAEKSAYAYLEKAKDIYLKLDDSKNALRVWRLLPKTTIQAYLDEIALAEKAEGTNSIVLANDIKGLFHFAEYSDFTDEQKTLAGKYADMGISIYTKYDSTDVIYLLGDVGYYYKKQLNDPAKALKYYLQAQKHEEKKKQSLYYNAFNIAAIYIELDSLDFATIQYLKALKEELSPTDKERAYFGMAMVAQIGGNTSGAKTIWEKHITDTRIMNGISSFQSYFSAGKKKMIRDQALLLINAVGAINAKRIVENDWVNE